MKKLNFLFGLSLTIALFSCNKNVCTECHYEDANDQEVEIGEYCGDDIEKVESEGYAANDTTYTVHCGEH